MSEPKTGQDRRKFQVVRGTRDLLPSETPVWSRVEQAAREVFATYGFGEIRTPVFEPTELFARAVGGETDIVSKEMYTFSDNPDISEIEHARYAIRAATPPWGDFFLALVSHFISKIESRISAGEISLPSQAQSDFDVLKSKAQEMEALPPVAGDNVEDRRSTLASEIIFKVELLKFGERVSLRPEATASVCRAYIQHGMQQLPQPVKLYYIGPMFRRERPQKGRYRQFYQIGAEVLGGPGAPSIDAEVIEMVMSFFRKVGILDAKLEINSIGDQACRPGYIKILQEALIQQEKSFGQDSQRRIRTNPLRVLDSKHPDEQAVIESLPRITSHLCEDCLRNYEEVKHQLKIRGVLFKENWRLVRGLDYYVRTTFEITGSGLGSQDAMCGGGRYDGLVEVLGGPKNTKGVGFAIGQDRLIQSLEQGRSETTSTSNMDVLVVGTSPLTWEEATKLGSSLRRQGLRVYLPNSGTAISKAMDIANRERIRVAVIVGDNELSANKYAIRILRPFTEEGSKDAQIDTDKIELYGRLVKLRNDLERKLLGLLGESPVLFKGQMLSRLVAELSRKGIIPGQIVNQLQNLIPQLNRSIHGDALGEFGPEWVLVVGNTILVELDRLGEPLQENSKLDG